MCSFCNHFLHENETNRGVSGISPLKDCSALHHLAGPKLFLFGEKFFWLGFGLQVVLCVAVSLLSPLAFQGPKSKYVPHRGLCESRALRTAYTKNQGILKGNTKQSPEVGSKWAHPLGPQLEKLHRCADCGGWSGRVTRFGREVFFPGFLSNHFSNLPKNVKKMRHTIRAQIHNYIDLGRKVSAKTIFKSFFICELPPTS